MVQAYLQIPKRALLVMEDLLSKSLEEIRVEYLYDKGVIIPFSVGIDDDTTVTLQLVIDERPYIEVKVHSNNGDILYQTNRMRYLVYEIKLEYLGNSILVSIDSEQRALVSNE